MARGNKENLNPVQSKEEARKRGRNGGLASGQARRAKRDMKKTLEMLLELPLKDGQLEELDNIKSFAGMKGKNIDANTAILISMIQKAMKGSIMAAEFVRDTAGQRPEDILNIQGEDTELNINVSYGKAEDADDKD